MTDIQATLDYLRAQGRESEILEFKEAKNNFHFDELGKYFSALSNEANLKHKARAWLVFGIKDSDKSVVGSNFRNDGASLQSLKNEVANQTINRITFIEIHDIVYQNKRVLLFEIPAAPQGIPVTWKGHYYGRDDESLGPLNLEEIERIRAQNQSDDWSAKICEGATVDDLSPDAIAKARALYAIKNPTLKDEIQQWDDLTFLNKAKLCIQGKVTRTAILLLGKPESEHFLSPGIAQISWILKDRDGIEKDYEHFSCPFLLNADKVREKIRNLKYRYIRDGSLFPEEVDAYDPYIIREALNNCIAHQDYMLVGKINVVETEDSQLTFTNMGSFIPGSIERVIQSDAPEAQYRNAFLAQAMVNLAMIDTIGSGIKRMFVIQRKKYFPLPEYTIQSDRVKVVVTGKVLDVAYARKLAQMPDLSLNDIILLDKLQKGHSLQTDEVKHLRRQGFVEGRKSNLHISATVAQKTDQKADYLRLRGITDDYMKQMIIDYLKKFGTGSKSDFERLLIDKISDSLDENQKQHKLKNILQAMKKGNIIEPLGKKWVMSKLKS